MRGGTTPTIGPPPPKVLPELLLLLELELELKGELLLPELEPELKGELLVELLVEPNEEPLLDPKEEPLVVEEENGLLELFEFVDELDVFEPVPLVAVAVMATQPPALPEEPVELPELLVEPEIFELLVPAYMPALPPARAAALVAPLMATAEAPNGCPKRPSGGTCASPKWMSFQSSFPVRGLT